MQCDVCLRNRREWRRESRKTCTWCSEHFEEHAPSETVVRNSLPSVRIKNWDTVMAEQ